MSRIKLVIASMLVLMVAVVVLQNTEPVDTSILFFTFTLPRAFLLFATFVVGFVTGALWTAWFAVK